MGFVRYCMNHVCCSYCRREAPRSFFLKDPFDDFFDFSCLPVIFVVVGDFINFCT